MALIVGWLLLASPGCLLHPGPSAGEFLAIEHETEPASVEVTPSDDPRIADVRLIQDALRMIEKSEYTEGGYGPQDRPYVDYTQERYPDDYARRFDEAVAVLDELPSRFVEHNGTVVEFRYGREQ